MDRYRKSWMDAITAGDHAAAIAAAERMQARLDAKKAWAAHAAGREDVLNRPALPGETVRVNHV